MFKMKNQNGAKPDCKCSSIDLPSCWICDNGAWDNNGCLLCDGGSQNDIVD